MSEKTITRNPDYKAYVLERVAKNKLMPAIGFHIDTVEEGLIEGSMTFAEMHQQQNGFLHGGISAALCDIVSGFASYSLVEKGQKVFTVEAKVSYYHKGNADMIYAKGWVMKSGKRFHFCESEVYEMHGEEKVIIAKGNCTMCVISED